MELDQPPGAVLAARQGLTVRYWPPSGGALLMREADDLNEAEAMHLGAEEWEWLFMYGAAAAHLHLNPAASRRDTPASSTPEPEAQQAEDDMGAQASLLEDQQP